MSSPTSRTLDKLRKIGFLAGVVEKYNRFAGIRQDLFGFVDIAAVRPGHGVLFIQACAGASHATRRAKILAHPNYPTVSQCGTVEIWSWAKQGARGKRKTWTLRRETLNPAPKEFAGAMVFSGGEFHKVEDCGVLSRP